MYKVKNLNQIKIKKKKTNLIFTVFNVKLAEDVMDKQKTI